MLTGQRLSQPRSREAFESISVNSLGFAGSLFVRSDDELEARLGHTDQPGKRRQVGSRQLDTLSLRVDDRDRATPRLPLRHAHGPREDEGHVRFPVEEVADGDSPVPVEVAGNAWPGADPELDGLFLEEAKKDGMVSLKGHRSVGGMRASIYNAMPEEGVEALVWFMADFEKRHG